MNLLLKSVETSKISETKQMGFQCNLNIILKSSKQHKNLSFFAYPDKRQIQNLNFKVTATWKGQKEEERKLTQDEYWGLHGDVEICLKLLSVWGRGKTSSEHSREVFMRGKRRKGVKGLLKPWYCFERVGRPLSAPNKFKWALVSSNFGLGQAGPRRKLWIFEI